MSSRWKVSGKRVELAGGTKPVSIERRPGGWLLATLEDGSRLRFAATEVRGRLSALVDGLACSGELEQTARGSGTGGDVVSDLTAQFPGKVRKLLVPAGAPVKAGDPLLLVEAMKMEFSIKAPADGRVKAWRVSEGQQLTPGVLFLDWESQS